MAQTHTPHLMLWRTGAGMKRRHAEALYAFPLQGAPRLRDQALGNITSAQNNNNDRSSARRCDDGVVARKCTCQLAGQALAWHQRGLCLDRLLTAAQAETCQACNEFLYLLKTSA